MCPGKFAIPPARILTLQATTKSRIDQTAWAHNLLKLL